MPAKDLEDQILQQFCSLLTVTDGKPARIIGRPDRENPGRGGCDALVDRGGEEWAVEHTSVDAFRSQRGDSARFNRVVVPLEKALRAAFPRCHIEIRLEVGAIPTGVPWSRLAADLREQLTAALVTMPTADEFEDRTTKLTLPSLALPVGVIKTKSSKRGSCMVMRYLPRDQEAQLEAVMETALGEKCKRLLKYSKRGTRCALLLESVGPCGRDTFGEIFHRVADPMNLEPIAEAYLVETSARPVPWFLPLKLGARLYPDLPEFLAFLKLQYYQSYGSPDEL